MPKRYSTRREFTRAVRRTAPEGYLTARQTAGILGITEDRVYRLANKGYLPVVKENGMVLFSRDKVEEISSLDNYATLREAVSITHRTDYFLLQKINSGELSCIKLGKIYIKKEDLEKYTPHSNRSSIS